MREHEARRARTSGRWHPWIKRISNVAAHVSAASLLATGMASSLAARKPNSRRGDRGGSDQAHKNRDGGADRNREDKQADGPKEDRRVQQEDGGRSRRAGDGGQGHRSGSHDPQGDESSGVHSAASKQTADASGSPTPPSGGDGGGGGNNGDGGNNGGGGNNAGNAGSGFFDSPLATKARRRANDFDNAGDNNGQDGTVADVRPDSKSAYQTNSVTYTTGPDGLEIHTGNITYSAAATPTPEPLPRLELPEHGPEFPFGENFPFGNAKTGSATAASEPTDPGDTGAALTTRAKPIFDSSGSEPANSDGGDNSMDFLS